MAEGDRAGLVHRFRRQEQFARGYSPLYERLFAAVAGWLEADRDTLADWLVGAAAGRQSLDVTLLLAAGLYRDILAGEPAVARVLAGGGLESVAW